jgi:hypothetical protein
MDAGDESATPRLLAGALLAIALQAGAVAQPAAASGAGGVSEHNAAGAVRLGATTNVKLTASGPVSRVIPLEKTLPLGAACAGCRVVLEVGAITFSTPPSTAYDVYVGMPAGAGAAPKPSAARHVGKLTFYGLSGTRAPSRAHETGQLFDITSVARSAAFHGDKIAVSFVPFALVVTDAGHSAAPPPSDLEIGRIEVRLVKAP